MRLVLHTSKMDLPSTRSSWDVVSPAVLSFIIKRHTVCKAWMPPLESGGGMFTSPIWQYKVTQRIVSTPSMSHKSRKGRFLGGTWRAYFRIGHRQTTHTFCASAFLGPSIPGLSWLPTQRDQTLPGIQRMARLSPLCNPQTIELIQKSDHCFPTLVE